MTCILCMVSGGPYDVYCCVWYSRHYMPSLLKILAFNFGIFKRYFVWFATLHYSTIKRGSPMKNSATRLISAKNIKKEKKLESYKLASCVSFGYKVGYSYSQPNGCQYSEPNDILTRVKCYVLKHCSCGWCTVQRVLWIYAPNVRTEHYVQRSWAVLNARFVLACLHKISDLVPFQPLHLASGWTDIMSKWGLSTDRPSASRVLVSMVGTRVCSILGCIIGRVGCALALPVSIFTSSYI